ncbi:lysophospholipid acyltransferase family protein [soil metagenome]
MTVRPSRAQDLAWRLEAFGYDLFVGLFRLFPLDWASWIGGKLLRVIGPLNSAHRTARINIEMAFPDWPEAKRRKLLADQWENVGRLSAEFPSMDRILPSTGRVELVNGERLHEIAVSGRPVVFVSGHLSNWEVMPAAIVAAKVPCLMTYRAANNPYMDQRIIDSRRRYGVELFGPKGGDGAKEMLKALMDGVSVALMNDQKFNSGVASPFFGHLCHTAPAPTRMALRFGTVLQPMSVQRIKGARFRAVVHDPILVEDTGNRTEDIASGVAKFNAFMEERIRERPEEWFWVHKRWPAEVYKRK